MTVVRQQSHGIVKSAGERFAGTYELLEETLLHLPLRRLLLAQNVCKAFQQVVNNSMKIKRALFLEPATDETLTWQDRKGCAGGVWISSKTGENVPSLMLNPFMPLLGYRDRNDLTFGLEDTFTFHSFPCDAMARSFYYNRAGRAAVLRGAFGKFLLTHPPISGIEIEHGFQVPFGQGKPKNNSKSLTLTANAGMKCADLFALCDQAQTTQDRTEFRQKGGNHWMVVVDGIDWYTGWEMLDFLAMSHKDRRQVFIDWYREASTWNQCGDEDEGHEEDEEDKEDEEESCVGEVSVSGDIEYGLGPDKKVTTTGLWTRR